MAHQIKCVFAIIFILHLVHGNEEKNFTGQFLFPTRQKVTCTTTEDCAFMFGEKSECVENQCTHTEILGPLKNRNTVTKINERCVDDEDCNINDSMCWEEYCQCHPDKVVSVDQRRCLNISKGLETHCIEDIQCLKLIEHSVCGEKKVCVCDKDFHNVREHCFRKIDLGNQCDSDAECSHIEHSKCYVIFCDCNPGYVRSLDAKECLRLANPNDRNCKQDSQCAYLGNKSGICVQGKCACSEGYDLKEFICEQSDTFSSADRNSVKYMSIFVILCTILYF